MSGLRLCLYEEPTNVVKQIEKSKHKSLQQTIANSHLNIDLISKRRFGFRMFIYVEFFDLTLEIKCYKIKIILYKNIKHFKRLNI